MRNQECFSDLTCIIPFKNEGIEVDKTIESILSTSNPKIIIINDNSDDNFDYKYLKTKYHQPLRILLMI